MKTQPYWLDEAPKTQFPALQGNVEVDVVVVGAGITGVTAAYLLKKAGATVALIERGRWGTGETGHTTAHLTYVTDQRLRDLVKTFGKNHAQAVWEAGLAAMQRIEQIAEEEKIGCEFTWVPGHLHTPERGQTAENAEEGLREEARLASELGFDAVFLESVPLLGRPGVRFANQAKFHPLKYLGALIAMISGDGSHVFEQTEVTQIELPKVKANGHTLRCRYVVIATHVPLQGATGTVSAALFQTKLASYSTYAVGAQIPTGSAPEASFWDTADPYEYLRIDRGTSSDYAILGGSDHKTGQAEDIEARYAALENHLQERFRKCTLQHRWSGQVVETNDGLPYIGETAENQFVATGFSGNGMTFGTLAAMMASDQFLQRPNPWRELFDTERKITLRHAWDYLKENKDYPFYMARAYLSAPGDEAFSSVKRGEGKVLLKDGEKVAVYRDGQGRVTARSAVCPHMGCIVRWNGTEKTWDCPCHGSRFEAKGTVMAGPAEDDLPDPGA